VTDRALVSIVFLSYNNARFIRRAIESALSQTYDRFEVIAVDDGSSDESVSILESYGDPRIKIFPHPHNLGLTPSYNEAVARASGDFVVNLDSDDAMSPTRTALQLEAFAGRAEVDVVGTYVEIIDENDQPHERAPELESLLNQPWDFNLPATWIGQNNLVRSATMMRRGLHERVGPNELGMLRAPDYDLWTRCLQSGGRFLMIPERLTQYRLHKHGLTYGDPKATFLELSYSLIRRLLPMISAAEDWQTLEKAHDWMTADPQFMDLPPDARARLAALFLNGWDDSFRRFEDALARAEALPVDLAEAGRRRLQLEQSAKARLEAMREAADWHAEQGRNWKAAAEWRAQQVENWKAAFEGEKAWRQQLQVQLGLAPDEGESADKEV
jgi:glycosyltransferase involved in cell wall biosynthesis